MRSKNWILLGLGRFRGRIASVAALVVAAGLLSGPGCASLGAPPSEEHQRQFAGSANFQDGKFINALPRWQGSKWTLLRRWMAGGTDTKPEVTIPIVRRTAAEFDQAPEDGLRVTWLGHSTFYIEIDGGRFLVDPVWSKRASPFQWIGPARFHPIPIAPEELLKLKIDAIVISHDHYDHLDHNTILALAKTNVRFVVPLGVGSHLRSWGIAPQRIVELDWWQDTKIGTVTLTATPSRHFSGRKLSLTPQDTTLWSGWAFRGPKRSAYYSGDTAMFPGFKEIGRRLGPFDVTMMETGAYNALWPDVHIGPEQAVQAHRDVRGKVMLPVHWGTFELAMHAWTEPMERTLVAAGSEITVIAPRPGESIIPTRPPQLARWWPNVKWQSAQESPVVSTGLAPTKTAGNVPAPKR